MNQCPCGSQTSYLSCCGIYITNQAVAATPEALMRSRYTAYTLANIAYIKRTMRGAPLLNFNENDAKQWATQVKWLGLQVIRSYFNQSDKNTGFVEFIASFEEGNQQQHIHELSEFQRDHDLWFYIKGHLPQQVIQKQKTSRNAPCPCGSKKKFKNCCIKK